MIERLRMWFSTPLMLPRWTLLVLYFLFVLLSVVAVVKGALGLLTYDGWGRWVLSFLVLFSSVASFVFATRNAWAKYELWASLGIMTGMAGYIVLAAFIAQDGGSWYTLILLVFVTLLVTGRWWTLLGVYKDDT